MEGEGDPLSEGESNAAKPLLTRFCVAKSVTSPSKPPSSFPNLAEPDFIHGAYQGTRCVALRGAVSGMWE